MIKIASLAIILLSSLYFAVPAAAEPAAPVTIGGDFALTGHDGKTVRDADLRGKAMLVFFGFTHCPDICPVGVSGMSKAMELLGKDADKVAPLFITVDPVRDTPEVMKSYLSGFDGRIVGLTGSAEDIKKVLAGYKAYAEVPQAHGDHGGHAEKDYNVNHSGMIYLMGRDGAYVRHFPHSAPAEEIAAGVRDALKESE